MASSPFPGIAAILMAIGLSLPLSAQDACAQLASVRIAHTEVTSAVVRPAGTVGVEGSMFPPTQVPARCVVSATARPTSDSEIKIEVSIPMENWNGKYLQSGNGGWAGTIPLQILGNAVRRGYAAAGTDNGHAAGGEGGPAGWAVG